jgi:hypothetical protein
MSASETPSPAYRTNDDAISHETIDGEVIAIHYRTGHYFSLRDTAAALWQALAGGASVAQLQAAAGCRTPEENAAVEVFVAGLVADELVQPVDGPARSDSPTAPTAAGAAFAAPVVERYADLEQLLLADPLHEVDDMGWPHPAPASA